MTYALNTFALKNRVEAVNKLHTWFNAKVPVVEAHIKARPYKVNKDKTGLFKKDLDALQEIIKDPPFRAYFRYSEYSGLSLHADIHYPVKQLPHGGEAVQYYDISWYENTNMANPPEFKPLALLDYDGVLSQAQELPRLEEEKRALESEINFIKRLVGEGY